MLAENDLGWSRKTSPKGQFSPQACFDVSLFTVRLGGELPLCLLPEPAVWCGSGCWLLHPGCDLPDPIVSNSPSPQGTAVGPLGQSAKGSHVRPGPAHCILSPSGPGTGGAARPKESLAQPGLSAQAGLPDFPHPENPGEAIAVLEGWGTRESESQASG